MKTYPCVSNSQTSAREALKQDAQLDPKVIQELFSTPGARPMSGHRPCDEGVPSAYVLPVIVRLGGFVLWMPMCPFCEMEHMHSLSSTPYFWPPSEALQACQGRRAPHCGQFGWPANYEDTSGDYRLVWRGEAARFAPGALSDCARPSRAANETARRLEACGVRVSYKLILSSIPSKIWRRI